MRSEAVSDPIEEDLTPAAASQEVHLLDLLIVLSKRRKFIGLFTISVAILAAITVLLLPSAYTAETLVLPPGQNSSMSSALLGQLSGSSALASAAGASLGIKSPGDMYVSLFRSRTVEDAMIQRFGLMARYRTKKMIDARKAFEQHSKVTLGTKDGLITISVEDRDPNMAAEIANGYVDQFRKLSANLAITEASQRRMFFEQQLKEANESLTNAEDAMKRTQQSTGVLQVDSQARSLIESAAVLRGQIVSQEVQLQGMRSYATEDNPQVVTAEQQLAALKGQLAKLSGSDANSSSEIIVPKGNIPAAGMEYLRKLRDVRYYETIEQLIAKQFEMAKLDEARQGAIVQVADVAVPPDKRSFPKRTITVIVATLLAFFFACGWCLLANVIERMKRNPDDRQRLDNLRASLQKSSKN
jgi:uncharacterized protein involved in exopolysaccharide biosynthesis